MFKSIQIQFIFLFKKLIHFRVIFVFHKNNNTFTKAKVKPPRLNGKRVGVLSTRSPYRPNPIGLTLAKLDKIEGTSSSSVIFNLFGISFFFYELSTLCTNCGIIALMCFVFCFCCDLWSQNKKKKQRKNTIRATVLQLPCVQSRITVNLTTGIPYEI